LVQRVREHPAQYVCCAILFAFVGGVNTICLLFGQHFLKAFSVALALYATVTSLICIFIFSYILIKALVNHNPQRPY